MKRAAFINHLTSSGCVVVREAKQGYTVVRNVINGKMSGVPSTDPPRLSTMCMICKTLNVCTPEEALSAQAHMDVIHNYFSTSILLN